MILLTHIIIAIINILTASYAVLTPSKNKLKVSSAMAVFTLASGIYLVVRDASHLVSSCISGITFISVVSVLLSKSYRKLQTVKNK